MRNKYKNLQNRGESQKGSSFVIPERRNQIITDTNINYINKNSFISNFEKREFDDKLFNKNNDNDKKRILLNNENLNQKIYDSSLPKNITNTIKTSNHNVLISVYKKDTSNNKRESIGNLNTSTNTNLIKVRNDMGYKNINTGSFINNINNTNINTNITTNITTNNTITKDSYQNSRRIFSNRIQSQNSKINIQDKKQNTNRKSYKKENNEQNKDKDKNKNKIEVIEIKFDKKNNDNNKKDYSISNYKRKKNCASYNNIINNTEINIENNDNKKIKDNKIIKPEIKTPKVQSFQNNYNNNYSSVSNISSINKPENTNNLTNNYSTTTERNNYNKKKLINFRKIRKNENILNDDMSVNAPPSSYILSPNNNFNNRIKRKMTYRSKRASNKIIPDEKESLSINKENEKDNNKDNNDNNNNNDNDKTDNIDIKTEKNLKKRKYLIKVAKTPNESNTHKNTDNDAKTEDINAKKKKIRHFLYFKSNKEKEREREREKEKEKEKGKENDENKEEKEKKEKKEKNKKEENLFTPKNVSNSNTISKSEIINSSPSFKKLNNKIYKISPKHSFKDLLHEANQNKNLQDSFTNIFQSCKSDIKNYQTNTNTIKSLDNVNNNSFSCFSNELELNLDNKNLLFNYINSSNISNNSNSSNNIFNTNSNINRYKNNSVTRNKNHNNKAYSPSNIIYKKKMNLIKSISNYYKKNIGVFSPKFLLNSNSNINIRKYNNFDINNVKSDKKEIKQNEYSSNISNNIINNNTYNTTLNIFKMNDISLKDIKNPNDIVKIKKPEESIEIVKKEQKPDELDKKHIRTNSDLNDMKSSLYFSVFNENNSNTNSNINANTNSNIIYINNPNSNNNITNSNHKKNKSIISCTDLTDLVTNNSQKTNENTEFNNNDDNFKIDLEILYILETKLQNIINKINNYMVCPNECFDLITYYFSSKFYEKEIKLFKLKHNINNISYCIKLELLCYFLCYDVCFNKSFSQTGILLKTIFNLLYNNYLILISYILNDDINNNNNNSNEWVPKLKSIINKNLNINILPQDYNETNILSLISANLKEVNNYYKMIIDNLYSHFYSKKNNKKDYNDSKYKFPHCLQLDLNDLDYYEKLNIISLFFFDAYRLLNNYNFEDLKYFFDSFLQRIKFTNQKNTEKKIKSPRNKISDSKGASIKNVIIYKYNYNNGNFYYLPPIKKYYKYTLVLDLDETLVYLMPNSVYLNDLGKLGESKHTLIFRPGLIDFLRKMRPLYELVIFSFGTFDYVDSVIKIIEKNEKFFEYVLYRQHATINNGEYIKDLSLLGRDLKNIIIVDDIPQVFKMQEKNGICIKAFYGDIVTERNTLKILGKILERVRFDADEDGDIRKSLDKQRNLILTHITNTLD